MKKIHYSLSKATPQKSGEDWQVRATPNAYASELFISFFSLAEAEDWLANCSHSWLAKLEKHKNSLA